MSTLGGIPIRRATVRLSLAGVWSADVHVAAASPVLEGAVELVVGDLTVKGTIPPGRGGPVEAEASYHVVGGAGGWGKAIGAKSYRNDAGVKLSMVLKDAAAAAGEKINIAIPDRSIGAAFVRVAGLARHAFAVLRLPWWVDDLGVTQVGPRPAVAVPASFSLLRWTRHDRLRTVDTAAFAALAPGATIEGEVIRDVTIRLSSKATRVEVRT